MSASPIRREVVDGDVTVEFCRSLREVRTDDGNDLVVVHKQPTQRRPRAAVMFVHGLGQNRYSWTLPRRSLENYFVAEGFETFNVELRGHGLSRANECEGPEFFETYLYSDMPALFDAIAGWSGSRPLFYVGHSLGAAISYCVGSRFQDRLAGIVAIAGPYNMAEGNLFMRALAKLGVVGNRLMDFKRLHPDTFYIDLLGIIARYGLFFFDSRVNPFPMRIWYPGSIRRDILEDRIAKGFDRTSFNVFWLLVEWSASGKLHGSESHEDLERHIEQLRIPILFAVGDEDDVVPVSSIQEGYDRAGSTDKTLKIFGSEQPGPHFGHCDIICGDRAPQHVWPFLARWMGDRMDAPGDA